MRRSPLRRLGPLGALLAAAALAAAPPRPAAAQGAPEPQAERTAPAATPRPITLEEAVAMARKNAPGAVAARGRTRTSEAGKRSAAAAFLPSLSVSAGATRQLPAEGDRTRIENGQIVTIPDDPWSFSTGVGANLQIFDGGRRIQELKRSRADLEAAETSEEAEGFNVALDVKRAYFNVLAAREALDAARAQLGQAEQQLRAAVLRVRTGTATKSDSLRSEIQMRNARLAVLTAGSDLTVADASLTRVVGATEPVTAGAQETGVFEGLALAETELARLADDGPAVREAKAQLASARAARGAARAAYFPTVSAGYSYSGSGTDSKFGFGDDPFSYNGSLRMSLSLPVFDQLNREEQGVRAGVAVENAEAALRDARLAAREELARAVAAYRTAEERVLTQAATVSTAEEDLRVQEQRYRVGASTLLDLLTSQTQITEARQALIRARYDQRVAKAELEALVGRPL